MPLPPDKEIQFLFDKEQGLVQTIVPRRGGSNNAIVEVQGTISASSFVGGGVGGNSVSDRTTSIYGFGDNDYYFNSSGTLRGNNSGFTAAVLVQPEEFPGTITYLFSNFELFQTKGGWYLGVDSNSWKWGVGAGDTGAVSINGDGGSGLQNVTQYQGRYIRRFFLLHLVFDGTNATLFVNGQNVQTFAPVSGYREADADLRPMIGRNNSNGTPRAADNLGFVGAGYVESAFSDADALTHYKLCLDNNTFVDNGFSNMWVATSGTFALTDSIGTLDWTLSGSLSQSTNIARW